MSNSPVAQINESLEFDEQGKLTSQNILINIREASVEQAYTKYKELRNKIMNGNGDSAKTQSDHAEGMTCPCGGTMILRKGRNGVFMGCSSYPQCKQTKTAKDVSPDPVLS